MATVTIKSTDGLTLVVPYFATWFLHPNDTNISMGSNIDPWSSTDVHGVILSGAGVYPPPQTFKHGRNRFTISVVPQIAGEPYINITAVKDGVPIDYNMVLLSSSGQWYDLARFWVLSDPVEGIAWPMAAGTGIGSGTYTPPTVNSYGTYSRASGVNNGTKPSYSSTKENVDNYIKIMQVMYDVIFSEPDPEDPYAGAGDSGPGGGGGDFDYTGDPPAGWDPTNPPGISVLDTGFVTLYNPTVQQLKNLAGYLWSSAFDLDTFKRIFNDPMDSFIGLSIIPVPVPDGGSRDVGIGSVLSGVQMTLAGAQYIPVDCGTKYIKNFSGSYLDYDPYTKVEIFLPYIGTRTLKADEVIGHNLHVGYWVDILSGACTAWLDVDGVPMYQFMGQCATSVPMASGDWTNLINGIIGAVGAVASGAAAGGVGGAIAGGVAAASAVAVNDGKIQVERSGAVTSAAGLMGLQVPTLYISSPWLHKPEDQNTFEGYPAYFTATLGNMAGFTTVENIRLQGIPATDPELQEIETLLKGGVIL